MKINGTEFMEWLHQVREEGGKNRKKAKITLKDYLSSLEKTQPSRLRKKAVCEKERK